MTHSHSLTRSLFSRLRGPVSPTTLQSSEPRKSGRKEKKEKDKGTPLTVYVHVGTTIYITCMCIIIMYLFCMCVMFWSYLTLLIAGSKEDSKKHHSGAKELPAASEQDVSVCMVSVSLPAWLSVCLPVCVSLCLPVWGRGGRDLSCHS